MYENFFFLRGRKEIVTKPMWLSPLTGLADKIKVEVKNNSRQIHIFNEGKEKVF